MSSISNWSEGIIFSLLFVALMAIVIGNFNLMYNEDESLPFVDNTNTTSKFIERQATANEQIEGGEALFDAREGITLKSSWGIAKDFLFMGWNFLSGGWIESTVGGLGLGESGTALAKFLRILYIASVIFAILYVLFKVEV